MWSRWRGICCPRVGVGAENPDTASDQRVHSQSADLAVTVHRPRGMISRCGLPTRVPVARPRAELADAARTFRGSQGRGDLGASSRGRRAAPTQPAPDTELGRPRAAQRPEPAPAGQSAPAAARVTENPAALARPAGRPPLELSATTTWPPNHVANGSGAGVADGPGEPTVGVPTHPRRAGRPRPSDLRVHRVDHA